jgi:hypothetical protein
MTDNGSMIKVEFLIFYNKLLDLEYIFMLMELNMKEIGKMINRMEMVSNNGLMAHNTKEHMFKERRKVMAYLDGRMGLIMMENS